MDKQKLKRLTNPILLVHLNLKFFTIPIQKTLKDHLAIKARPSYII